MVFTPPRAAILRRWLDGDSDLSRKVRIQVRGTSAGSSLRSAASMMTAVDSGQSRERENVRWSRVMPLQNNRRASRGGMDIDFPSRALRRAYQAIGPLRVSTIATPCGGTDAAMRIISRTRDDPLLATTPGTVS